mmetsp:Transcript_29195/g.39452  ORF Transcript_29195/g.39452 Transcript_29195/m.39452 type:complete len:183 (+) Transcript_29195:57-605(+)
MGDAMSSEIDTAVQGRIPVRLNIYDLGTNCTGRLLNSMLRPLGTGAFHCGVEVLGYEWSFRSIPGRKSNGVFWCLPRQCRGHAYSESLHMGYSDKSEVEVLLVLQKLADVWFADDYDVMRRNCCHFSDDLCRRLGVGRIPNQFRNLADTSAAVIGPLCWLFACNELEVQEEEAEEEILINAS